MRLILTIVLMFLATGCASQNMSTRPANGFPEVARAYLQGFSDRQQFSGFVLVATGGSLVLADAYGLADREMGAVADADTIFSVGSISKQFTAVAVLQLAEQGSLRLDDPVSRYYPDAPPVWREMTIRHLLGHRSGILNYQFIPNGVALQNQGPTAERLLAFMRDVPLEFEPGTKFAYGNSGPVVLGYIIEKVSGRSYADYMHASVFAPVGMTRTFVESPPVGTSNIATGYSPNGAPVPASAFAGSAPSGGIYTTARDLLAWDQAIGSDKLLSTASRHAMEIDAEDDGAGFLVFTSELHERKAVHACGANPGFLACVLRFTDDGVTIIALGNLNGPVEDIALGLSRLYFDAPEQPPTMGVRVDPATLDRYVGDYELFPGGNVFISRQADDLMMRQVGAVAGPPMPQPIRLIAVSETTFMGPDARIVFPPVTDGRAPQISFTVPRLKTERMGRRIE